MIEYSLLLAVLALASAGVFMQVGRSGAGVWSGANTTIARADTTASGTTPAPSTPTPPGGAKGSGGGGDSYRDHNGRH